MFSGEEIVARARMRPFHPFRIVSSSGESYTVTHPELVMVGRRDVVIGTASPRNPSVYETIARVALMHISDIQDVPAGAETAPSGAR